MSRPSSKTLQRRRSLHRCVAAVFVVMLSSRMLVMTDGVTATLRSPAAESDERSAENKPAESGDFLAMSDVGTGKELNSRHFRVARSEFSDYCSNGDCISGDVLKVVSKLAKRILSDPRILGLRTTSQRSADDYDVAEPPEEESAARAVGGSSFDTRPFSRRSDFYDSDRNRIDPYSDDDRSRANERYKDDERNRLNERYNDPDSYHAPATPDTSDNYRQRDRHSDAYGSSPAYEDPAIERGSTRSGYNDRDGGYSESYSGGGGDSYGGGGGGYGGGGGGYGGGSSYGGSSYGGYDTCCQEQNKLLPILLVGLLGLLAFFLYVRSTTTTAAAGKRSIDDNDLSDVLLDGPTWLSMVHELWEQDAALENTACTQETLCRMNRLAMAAPGQAGWAVSLSSLPLSYLLHTRHTGGFSSYMDAAMMGRSGANCTELYSSCPRLSY